MKLPQEPTKLPQARRYMRRFEVERGKIYRSKDIAQIQIPPIDKTYLTKNTKLHFLFTAQYYEISKERAQQLSNRLYGPGTNDSTQITTKSDTVANFFGYANNTVGDNIYETKMYSALNSITKALPSLDINGAYGLISRIQVYDYLGTTLLEDIQGHDVLTSILTDFKLIDDPVSIHRPEIVDVNQYSGLECIRKAPCSLMDQDVDSYDQVNNKAAWPYSISIQKNTLNIAPTIVSVEPSYVTYQANIDMISFLGVLSNKFVPLHNGFTIKLHFNDFTNAFALNTKIGSGIGYITDSVTEYGPVVAFNRWTGTTTQELTLFPVDPSLIDATITNVYMQSDLLELTSELDSQVEKVVQSKGYRYQLDFFPQSNVDGVRTKYTRRILPELQSVTRTIIGQRPVPITPARRLYQECLGWRFKNYVDKSTLLYNKAIVSEFNGDMEAYNGCVNGMGKKFDSYINYDDFVTNEYLFGGTQGQQFEVLTQNAVSYIASEIDAIPNSSVTKVDYQWFNRNMLAGMDSNPYLKTHATSFNQGKYLLVHDLRLPEIPDNSIGGINTIKQVLEYELESNATTCQNAYIDVFCEHDAFIHVDPGKATAVSF